MNASAAMAGKKGKCPHCQTVLVIGGGTPAAAPQPAFGGLQPLGEADLQPLDSPQAWSDPLSAPGGGLAPLGGGNDLFASLPAAQPLAGKPLAAAPSPLGYTPSTSPFGAGVNAPNPYASPNPYAASPYASPYGAPMPGPYARPTVAPLKVMLPAIFLLFFSVISLGWLGITGLNAILQPLPPPPPELDEAGQAGYKAGYYFAVVAIPVVGMFVNLAVIAGGIQMIRLKGYDMARGGAWAAIVPCSLCCITNIPFGIWALIVLNQPDVRRMFQ
jgi:hypothetical protein